MPSVRRSRDLRGDWNHYLEGLMVMRNEAVRAVLLGILLVQLPGRIHGQQENRPTLQGVSASGRGLTSHRLFHPAPGRTLSSVPSVRIAEGDRTSPGWARYAGGLVTGAAGMIGILAATWNGDSGSEGLGAAVMMGGMSAGTLIGSALVTSIWEKPNEGLVLGALAGSLPMIVAVFADDDAVTEWSLAAGVFGAPLGAAVGQSMARQ
jgi:hypothetical protein